MRMVSTKNQQTLEYHFMGANTNRGLLANSSLSGKRPRGDALAVKTTAAIARPWTTVIANYPVEPTKYCELSHRP